MNVIINLHEVSDHVLFERTLNILSRKFNIINIHQLEEYINGNNNLNNICHLTFDDGHISFYNIVFPILKKYKIPATLFVSPLICRDSINFWFQDIKDIKEDILIRYMKDLKILPANFSNNINDILFTLKCLPIENINEIINNFKTNEEVKKNYNINLHQLLEISSDGLVEIGAHTLSHPILNNEDEITSAYEISESIQLLESLIGKKIKYFAYPNGIPNIDFSKREIILLKNSNISLAFSTEPKTFSAKDNPLSLPRLTISNNNIMLVKLKIMLLKYWNLISLLWHPDINRRRKFLEIARQTK